MTYESNKKDKPFENMGRRLDEDIEKLISYLNDEVVPSVRSHSTKALRIAAEQMQRLADYMDQKESSAKSTNQDSDQDIGS